ncbi:response regulator transcription factor [Actinacidiphila paucisporea]|uniref:DNA-binding response regulator, NarL/FixJ family, contains REC and HTH domains n=1 Tax=Actinacidiphila paucisporea TaxID=310782 RepID=A0A1M7PTC5_9ACTN|nr:response regulator transcription factor [Actinacidiphila paucisporea]SHN20726.1 DNA-binding response regulator, NarL/FixJ family, contains REC and HTH domains [Actinacidiphila paucisporea]
MVAEAGDIVELLTAVDSHEPDVVVLEGRSQLDHVQELTDIAAALVVLGDVDSTTHWIRFTQAKVYSLVHCDDPEEELVQAVRRATDGTGYVSPGLSGALLKFTRAILPRHLSAVPMDVPLTSRESEVLQLVRRGMANKEIARRLGLSEKTIKFHVSNVLAKAHMASRAQLIASAAAM